MNLYDELIALIEMIKESNYLLVGGIAYSIYAKPRFTEDIDFLICEDSYEKVKQILLQNKFLDSGLMQFKSCKIGRFVKIEDEDHLIVGFLLKDRVSFVEMFENKEIIRYNDIEINLVSIENLIQLKQQRNSKQDILDIEELRKIKNG